MAAVTPPEITPPPTPAPQRGNRSLFREQVDAFITWMAASVAQFMAVAHNVYENALAAFGSAGAAAGSAEAANGSVGQALEHRNAAGGFKTDAETAKTQAETARDAALNYAAALNAASTTSLLIGTGSKTLTVQPGRQFITGGDVKIIDAGNSANVMYGTVTSYADTSLQVNVTSFDGSGTVANWRITLAGQRGGLGLTGGVNGGSLAGGLWEKKGVDVASAASIDPWSANGNLVPLIGVGSITSMANAPQAGALVTLLATGACSITAGANLKVKGLSSGAIYTCAPGDELDVRAETTTLFHVTIRKADGTPTVHNLGALHNLRRFTSSGVFTATKTGWHKVTVIGGSGSGGAATAGNVGTGIAGASGSGAGGFASGMRFLVAGQSYVVTVGAGGIAIFVTDAVRVFNGNDGSASSFMGAGIAVMTANGGAGGKATITASTSVAGGVGGSATGGDMNVKGGDGGAIRTGSYRSAVASGGGAVGLRGIGFNGGSAICPDVHSNNICVGAGGAGVGGRGGNATTTANPTAHTHTCGGGAGGQAADSADGMSDLSQVGVNIYGSIGGTVAVPLNDLDMATGSGRAPSQSDQSGLPGAGTGGCVTVSGGTGSPGGMFSGCGGFAMNTGAVIYAGSGGPFGGGAGGIANVVNSASSSTMNGGAGTPGAVWIEF
jgi:hypothetical protein